MEIIEKYAATPRLYSQEKLFAFYDKIKISYL